MAKVIRGLEVRADLHELMQSVPMTNVDLKANVILPELYLSVASGDIPVLPAGTGQKLTDNSRAADGSYNRTDYQLGKESYSTRLYGAEEAWDWIESMELSDVYSQEEVAAEIARNRILLGREKRVATTVMNATTFTGSAYSDTVGTKWDQSAADFRSDIRDASHAIRTRTKRDLKSMSLILTSDNVDNMLDTLAAKDSVKYTTSLLLNDPMSQLRALASYIGVKEIISVDGMCDKAGLGLDVDFDFLWDNTMAMLALLSPTTQSWKMPGLGRQPVFQKLAKDYLMESYDDESKDKSVVRCKEYRGEKLFKEFGFLIKGIA